MTYALNLRGLFGRFLDKWFGIEPVYMISHILSLCIMVFALLGAMVVGHAPNVRFLEILGVEVGVWLVGMVVVAGILRHLRMHAAFHKQDSRHLSEKALKDSLYNYKMMTLSWPGALIVLCGYGVFSLFRNGGSWVMQFFGWILDGRAKLEREREQTMTILKDKNV